MKFVRIALLLVIGSAVAMGQTLQVARGSRPPQATVSITPEQLSVVRAIYKDMDTRVPAPLMDHPNTATFVVTYNGFTPAAQAAFQRAVDIWSSILISPVPIHVTANWTALGPGILGSAGASSVYRDFPNAPQAGTWYAVALAEKLAGAELNGASSADINANFSSAIPNWYFGTDGNPPAGQFDLVTIVLHELGHGLTFAGSMTVTSGQGSWGLSGFPMIYDRFAENGAGQSLTNTSLFPNPSTTLATQLQSNSVFFNGPHAVTGNGGTRPPLYAPASWIQGSSYSHLDEATYPAGNPNSLMTPEFGMAEAIHNPGPVALGMFQDMGWSISSGGTSTIKYEETFPTTTIPAGWRVVDNDGGGVPIAFRQLIAFTSGDTVRPQAGASFWFGSYNGANSNGLIDEYVIGPRIRSIHAGDSLYFYAGAIGDQFPDSLRVFISTTDSSLSSFTHRIGYFLVAGPVGSWHLYGFDLSQFAGGDIFFAVNYYIVDGGPNGNNSDNVWIDHFMITTDVPDGVNGPRGPLPASAELLQNYPNPFNPSTKIGYQLPVESHVTLRVYDVMGREVATLVNDNRHAGLNEVVWNAANVASGVYFCRIDVQPVGGGASFLDMKKLTVMK